ncbi:MAG TPA: hypothetical protein DCM87_12080 [Planctomycetes bacterium]|nr:hypothetical protein [Planctomycetota bacterium]
MAGACLLVFLAPCAAADAATFAEPPRVEIAGDWVVRVLPGTFDVAGNKVAVVNAVELRVEPAVLVRVRDEKHDSLPLFNQAAAPWAMGVKLRSLATTETTAADMLVPESLALKSGPGDAPRYTAGKDYAFEPRWATAGRLPEGIPEGAPVWIDYDCGWGRLDAIVVARDGAVTLRQGTPHNATPLPPAAAPDRERTLARVWVPGRTARLTPENLYPIVEERYTEPPRDGLPPASKLLPKTWAKLHSGEPLHVLAWGDSVTAGGEASDVAHRYQNRFAALLGECFPKAKIRLTTAGWGGRNTDSFLAEPPGAEFNFDRAVIEPRPDLIVMEFVNDAWMTPPVVEEKYSYLLRRFHAIGAEWLILTPHFVRPDWMGAPSARVEADPRPYVEGLRKFAAAHHVALADAALRWGHLLKEGIPYTTLLSNSINHPDDRGHELFAQALIAIFR